MNSEVMLHIDENLNTQQRDDLLASLGNHPGGVKAHLHSTKPHLLFVAFDPEQLCLKDLVALAKERGVHAQVVEL